VPNPDRSMLFIFSPVENIKIFVKFGFSPVVEKREHVLEKYLDLKISKVYVF
jgi:hypothetical protein